MSASARRALEGIRVLECGHFLAGPFAATLLGDFGAEVVKIEHPRKPDVMRSMFVSGAESDPERSTMFLALARNKKSVTLDFESPRGRELLLDLVRQSDVIVENFRPGRMEDLALGPSDLHALNPGLVYLRVSGYGQEGPRRLLPSLDNIASAFAGLTALTGFPDCPPVMPGMTVADHGAALLGAYGVVLALLARERGGDQDGQVVDVALYDPVFMMLDDLATIYRRHGSVPNRRGNSYATAAPANHAQARDGKWLVFGATSDALFRRLGAAIGWDDERFRALGKARTRVENRHEVDDRIRTWVAHRSASEAAATLADHGVPAAVVQNIQDILEDEHVAARGDFVTLEEDGAGEEVVVAAPKPLLSRTPGSVRSAAPRLGEHTDAVLGSVLSLGRDELAHLHSIGIA